MKKKIFMCLLGVILSFCVILAGCNTEKKSQWDPDGMWIYAKEYDGPGIILDINWSIKENKGTVTIKNTSVNYNIEYYLSYVADSSWTKSTCNTLTGYQCYAFEKRIENGELWISMMWNTTTTFLKMIFYE